MMLPYFVRLLCLCLACFGLAQLVMGLGVSLLASRAIEAAERRGARAAARLLLAVRLLPAGTGLFLTLGLCLPSYLWLEEETAREPVGWTCLAAAMLGAWVVVMGLVRAGQALLRSPRLDSPPSMALEGVRCCVVASPWPIFALAGVFHERLLLSQGVLEALSPSELAAALGHERAHRAARDNLKRLLLRLTPLPGGALDRAWAKFAEWAADDAAARGDAERSLALASALVRIARLSADRVNFPLASSLLAKEGDLAARVERLLGTPSPGESGPPVWLPIALAAGLLVLAANPASLAVVHNLLEALMH
jgi:hypothetical protein